MSRSGDSDAAADFLRALGHASAGTHTHPDETSEGKRRLITTTPVNKKHRFDWKPRLAGMNDIPQLEALIPPSVRAFQADHYSGAQMEAALGPIFAVDRQLIRDCTYFVVEEEGAIVGCGGWPRVLMAGSLGHVKHSFGVLVSHVGLVLWPISFFLSRNFSQQKQLQERLKTGLLIVLCLGLALASSVEVWRFWHNAFDAHVLGSWLMVPGHASRSLT